MIQNSRSLLILCVVAGIIILGFIIYSATNFMRAPDYRKIVVDKDTGETLYEEPNRTPEEQAQQEVIVLGTPILLDNGLTQAQFKIAQLKLIEYINTNYRDRYRIIKILPDTFKNEGKVMYFGLKLGESDSTLPTEIQLPDIYSIRIIIKDSDNSNLYDSGIISTKDFNDNQGTLPEDI